MKSVYLCLKSKLGLITNLEFTYNTEPTFHPLSLVQLSEDRRLHAPQGMPDKEWRASLFGGLLGYCQYHVLDHDAEDLTNVSILEKPVPFLRSEPKNKSVKSRSPQYQGAYRNILWKHRVSQFD